MNTEIYVSSADFFYDGKGNLRFHISEGHDSSLPSRLSIRIFKKIISLHLSVKKPFSVKVFSYGVDEAMVFFDGLGISKDEAFRLSLAFNEIKTVGYKKHHFYHHVLGKRENSFKHGQFYQKKSLSFSLAMSFCAFVIVLFAGFFIYGHTRASAASLNYGDRYLPENLSSPSPFLKSDPPIFKVSRELDFVLMEEGETIYMPGSYGYRYGPSVMMDEEGGMHFWFAAPGTGGAWDMITYRYRDKEGHFSDETVALRATPGSSDHYSVCDPGAFYYDGYYYLGYTSTLNRQGIDNDLYVARSRYPQGPYEKWNGSGWGGKPQPIIRYGLHDGGWGIGEVSFVIKDDMLYLYYSYLNEKENSTDLAMAPLSENWPLDLEIYGSSIEREGGMDSSDVVYVEELDEFWAFSIGMRMDPRSYLTIFTSKDGREFELYAHIKDYMKKYAHNAGVSKDGKGHISIEDDLYISYAYAKDIIKWGRWPTYLQRAGFESILRGQ